MIQNRQKNIFQRKIVQVVSIIVLFGILMAMNPRGLFQPAREVLLYAGAPFMFMFHKVSVQVTGIKDVLGSFGSIQEENRSLQQQLLQLESQNAMCADVRDENELLRKELALAPRDTYALEAALVIGNDPDGKNSWILINKGSKHGLQPGMPVILREGILVGSVQEVQYTTAYVQLLTHPDSVINAHGTSNRTKGVIRGKYGLGLLFDRVLQTEGLQVGDAIVTSEIGEKYPPGLLIGTVQEIRLSDDNIFQQATILSHADFSRIAVVSVIKK